MFVIKQCKCGSTNFHIDDDTYRCEECERLAHFKYIEEENEEGEQ